MTRTSLSAVLKKRFDHHSFFGLAFTTIILGSIALLFLFWSLAERALSPSGIVLDVSVFHFFETVRDPFLTTAFLWVTLFGDIRMMLLIALIVSVMSGEKNRKEYIPFIWFTLFLAGSVSYISKAFFQRPRPIDSVYPEFFFSFPSAHTLLATAFYGFLLYVVTRHRGDWLEKTLICLFFFTTIFFIGISRLYLGVHYLSDVWAGFILGLLVLVMTISLHEWLVLQRLKERRR